MDTKILDALVIGGGFYGISTALFLKKYVDNIVILESEATLMKHASYVNQARVHNGYHYPRSILTGVRSRVNLPRFFNDYSDCIDSSFEKIYGIAQHNSRVTSDQFLEFSKRIGAAISPANKEVTNLFNKDMIEAVFRVEEYAFDSMKMRSKVIDRLKASEIDIRLQHTVISIEQEDSTLLRVKTRDSRGNINYLLTRKIFNCTYSHINTILRTSNLPIIPVSHEFVELAIVRVPSEIAKRGITIMDGPYFSIMPFPSKNLHSFSHVRYTPHFSWNELSDGQAAPVDIQNLLDTSYTNSHFLQMQKDAIRYMPILSNIRYEESLFTVKTILPRQDSTDARPILFSAHHGIQNLFVLMGGKIDNIYDVEVEIDLIYGNEYK